MQNTIKMEAGISRFSVVLVISVITLIAGLLVSSSTTMLHGNEHEAIAQQQSQQLPSSSLLLSNIVTIQNTSMSVPAPNAPVNKQSIPHQIVVALPLREDGKVWSGTVTFVASKPIEIEVEHKYNPKVTPDAKH